MGEWNLSVNGDITRKCFGLFYSEKKKKEREAPVQMRIVKITKMIEKTEVNQIVETGFVK